jgi:hypothetical protein
MAASQELQTITLEMRKITLDFFRGKEFHPINGELNRSAMFKAWHAKMDEKQIFLSLTHFNEEQKITIGNKLIQIYQKTKDWDAGEYRAWFPKIVNNLIEYLVKVVYNVFTGTTEESRLTENLATSDALDMPALILNRNAAKESFDNFPSIESIFCSNPEEIENGIKTLKTLQKEVLETINKIEIAQLVFEQYIEKFQTIQNKLKQECETIVAELNTIQEETRVLSEQNLDLTKKLSASIETNPELTESKKILNANHEKLLGRKLTIEKLESDTKSITEYNEQQIKKLEILIQNTKSLIKTQAELLTKPLSNKQKIEEELQVLEKELAHVKSQSLPPEQLQDKMDNGNQSSKKLTP